MLLCQVSVNSRSNYRNKLHFQIPPACRARAWDILKANMTKPPCKTTNHKKWMAISHNLTFKCTVYNQDRVTICNNWVPKLLCFLHISLVTIFVFTLAKHFNYLTLGWNKSCCCCVTAKMANSFFEMHLQGIVKTSIHPRKWIQLPGTSYSGYCLLLK